jgi:hypothetical protein
MTVKMAFRMGDKVSMHPEELLEWLKSLNPGLHMENWRFLNSRDEPTGRRLILLVDLNSANIIKKTSYKIFPWLSEGTIKVLSDPETEPGGGCASEG